MTNKYGARKTVLDGHTFDSQAEAERYAELRLAEQAGEITALVLQPRFDLHVGGVKVAAYVADFQYDLPAGGRVIEDVKGVRTPVYRLKAKMLRAEYGITVLETGAPRGRRR